MRGSCWSILTALNRLGFEIWPVPPTKLKSLAQNAHDVGRFATHLGFRNPGPRAAVPWHRHLGHVSICSKHPSWPQTAAACRLPLRSLARIRQTPARSLARKCVTSHPHWAFRRLHAGEQPGLPTDPLKFELRDFGEPHRWPIRTKLGPNPEVEGPQDSRLRENQTPTQHQANDRW